MSSEVDAAIDLAIRSEKIGYKEYLRFSKHAGNTNVESFFRELAIEELKHEHLLVQFKKVKDFKVAREEAENHFMNDNLSLLHALTPNVTFEGITEAFQKAIRYEQTGSAMYRKLELEAKDRSAKDLFHYLEEEELEHERMIRKEFDRFKRL